VRIITKGNEKQSNDSDKELPPGDDRLGEEGL